MTSPSSPSPPSPWTGAPATLANWRTAPHNAWAFHHVREVVPSAEIRNDPSEVAALTQGPDLILPDVATREGPVSFEQLTDTLHLDALVVARGDLILHESYRNGMDAHDPHILMSVSKSMLGLLYGILADKKLVDVHAKAEAYIPELKGTAFEGASIRDLLDMRSGLAFNEDYELTEGPIVQYRKSTNWNPLEPGEKVLNLTEFLVTLTEKQGPHGGHFSYISPCTDLLGWIVEVATGKPYATVFSELLWQPLGAERPAYITVDRVGAPRCAGGVCMTARDLARVGLAIADGGRGVIPEVWLQDIASAGDPSAWDQGSMAADFPNISMHYRSKWYVLRDQGPILMCVGIHGQNLFVDLSTGLVMVRYSSVPTARSVEGKRLALRLFETIRDAL